MTNVFKKLLFAGLVLMLFIPAGFKYWKPNFFGALKGYFVSAEDPDLTAETWFNGSFQSEKEKWIKENNSLYVGCVRLKNQLVFEVNKKAETYWVIVGKEDYLFEITYINAYTGRDFIGEEKIISQVQKLKRVQDTLQKMGITLLSVLAPGKGSFFAEYIPDEFLQVERNPTNYAVYVREMSEKKVNMLDFRKRFLAQKETASYPLFPKTGVHWSAYGEYIALDAILKKLAFEHDVAVPQIEVTNIEVTNTVRGRDQDIEDGMNLMYDIPDFEMAYLHYDYVPHKRQPPAKALVIADSYYYQMYDYQASTNAFNQGDFWYYNKQVFPARNGQIKNVIELDLYNELTKNEVIILLATDANMHDFGFGFIDDAYTLFFPTP